MDRRDEAQPVSRPGGSDPSARVGLLLLVPWPLLAIGWWSLYHVHGPAADGFGRGLYAAVIFSTLYALGLVALNRAVVYARRLHRSSGSVRWLYGLAIALYVLGVLGLVPTVFLLLLAFPYTLPAIVLILLALSRWTVRAKAPAGQPGDGAS